MEKLPVAELDFSKLDGLITVVTQASETGEVCRPMQTEKRWN